MTSPSLPTPADESLNAYAAWTEASWRVPLSLRKDPECVDLAVMALGLSGETGEVLDCLLEWESTGIRPSEQLFLEMGDVLFSWARIARTLVYGRFREHAPVATTEQEPVSVQAVLLTAARLACATAKVAEAVKKYNRDGSLDDVKINTAMGETIRTWSQLCSELGLSERELMRSNVDKLNARAAARRRERAAQVASAKAAAAASPSAPVELLDLALYNAKWPPRGEFVQRHTATVWHCPGTRYRFTKEVSSDIGYGLCRDEQLAEHGVYAAEHDCRTFAESLYAALEGDLSLRSLCHIRDVFVEAYEREDEAHVARCMELGLRER